MVIRLPPRLTANEIKEIAFTVKNDTDSKNKPNSMSGLFSCIFGGVGVKQPKFEFKNSSSAVEPINLSLKNMSHFSLDSDCEKPKSLFSYQGTSDSKSEEAKRSFMNSIAQQKKPAISLLGDNGSSGVKPFNFSALVK